MAAIVNKTFQYGEHKVVLETGEIARQATGSVLATMENTTVLATVVSILDEPDVERDFFPLTVNYQERHYASGRIPGGFIKRENRPSTRETLISRLIDRPLRPLFPAGFNSQVQVIVTVLSMNPEMDADIIAMLAASAAVAISGIPFNAFLGAAKVGYIDNRYVLNPSASQLKNSQLDLVVAGTEHAVLMVESEAKELSEEIMLNAVMFGHEQMQTAITAIKEFVALAAKPKWDWKPKELDNVLVKKVHEIAKPLLEEAYRITTKAERRAKIKAVYEMVISQLASQNDDEEPTAKTIKLILSELEEHLVRHRVIKEKTRIDGRDLTTIRPITTKVGILPRTHGSANFTRGETQALVITTLGTERDAQIIDGIVGETKENFMLHYNFPPYSVGEVGMVGSPKRREIGHGNLAKRALNPVVPDIKDFPYVLRVVSEITESNGSSSMASVCGGCLALMDAGVPLKAPVAGIAMGLIKEGNQFVVLSDILGDEDHLGDMDFKVAGTAAGVTALQMDIKIDGITREIMDIALKQAKEGRVHILKIMAETLGKPRENISDFAPRITIIKINPEKIKDVIGKGGSVIREIIEETGVDIDISEDGSIKIAAVDQSAAVAAQKIIEEITAEAEVGKIYEGKVVKITDFGAFVNILPGQDGLLHISQIANERIKSVTDKLHEGQMIKVKVLEIDRMGKMKLSMKEVDQ